MQSSKWYHQSGPSAEVVISTRVRFARNLADTPFTGRMNGEEKEKILERVFSAFPEDYEKLRLDQMQPISVRAMVEKHLISPEFASKEGPRGLVINQDNSTSVMVLEEDHIRIQCLKPGLQLKECLEEATGVDRLLEGQMEFAFDEQLGYLTHCPTNLGTGMRASVMLHLPALSQSGLMGALIENVSKLGLTFRGLYGEGTQAKGCLYQLSNQVTLGITEEETVEKLGDIAARMIEQELGLRKRFLEQNENGVLDSIWRAYGVLKYAHSLSSDEFMSLMSNVRMGAAMGLIGNLTLPQVDALVIAAGPANLMEQLGDMRPDQRDAARAKLVRENL